MRRTHVAEGRSKKAQRLETKTHLSPIREDLIVIAEDVVREIARRHGNDFKQWQRLNSKSLINYVILLGNDYVVRVPRDSDPCRAHQAYREARRYQQLVRLVYEPPSS